MSTLRSRLNNALMNARVIVADGVVIKGEQPGAEAPTGASPHSLIPPPVGTNVNTKESSK